MAGRVTPRTVGARWGAAHDGEFSVTVADPVHATDPHGLLDSVRIMLEAPPYTVVAKVIYQKHNSTDMDTMLAHDVEVRIIADEDWYRVNIVLTDYDETVIRYEIPVTPLIDAALAAYVRPTNSHSAHVRRTNSLAAITALQTLDRIEFVPELDPRSSVELRKRQTLVKPARGGGAAAGPGPVAPIGARYRSWSDVDGDERYPARLADAVWGSDPHGVLKSVRTMIEAEPGAVAAKITSPRYNATGTSTELGDKVEVTITGGGAYADGVYNVRVQFIEGGFGGDSFVRHLRGAASLGSSATGRDVEYAREVDAALTLHVWSRDPLPMIEALLTLHRDYFEALNADWSLELRGSRQTLIKPARATPIAGALRERREGGWRLAAGAGFTAWPCCAIGESIAPRGSGLTVACAREHATDDAPAFILRGDGSLYCGRHITTLASLRDWLVQDKPNVSSQLCRGCHG